LGSYDLAHDALVHGAIDDWRRRIRAMPPVFGRHPRRQALVILRGRKGEDIFSVAMTMKLASSPGRNSSRHLVAAESKTGPSNIACAVAMASSALSTMITPLPARATGFDDDRRCAAAHPGRVQRSPGNVAYAAGECRDA